MITYPSPWTAVWDAQPTAGQSIRAVDKWGQEWRLTYSGEDALIFDNHAVYWLEVK